MYRKGDIVEEKYKVLKRLGKGAYGSVFLVEMVASPSEQYAMKVLENSSLTEEVKVGLSLGSKSPYTVKFKEAFAVEEDVIIIMEFCSGGTLAERIKKNQPPTDFEIFRFMFESTMAVKYLHDHGIVHRDINPQNFLLGRDGGYKLGDYGLSKSVEALFGKTMSLVGTNGYTAIEILQGKKIFSNKIDVFSLGVTLAEFILGHNPFSNPGEPIDLRRALDGRMVDAALKHPHPAMEIARKMLAVDPSARPSPDEVVASPLPVSLPSLHALAVAKARADAAEGAQVEADVLRRERDCAVAERDDAVREAEKAKRERDSTVGDKDRAVREAEALRREKDRAVREAEALRGEKDSAMREKDSAVREKDSAVREKDRAVREKDSAVREKDNAVRSAETAKKEKEAMRAERDRAVAERDGLLQDTAAKQKPPPQSQQTQQTTISQQKQPQQSPQATISQQKPQQASVSHGCPECGGDVRRLGWPGGGIECAKCKILGSSWHCTKCKKSFCWTCSRVTK